MAKIYDDVDDTITIPRFRFNQMLAAEEELIALEHAGVDNWEGYDNAMDILREMRDEKENDD